MIATFDLLDGNGKKGNILAENKVTITSPYNSKKIETDSTSCTIELTKIDNFNGNITKLELFKNNDKVSDLLLTNISGDVISIDNLLSNTEYSVVITYEYTLNTEKIIDVYKVDIKTKAKDIPTLEIIIDDITSSKVKFKYNVLKDTSVNITSIKLLKEEDVIATLTNLTNLSFTNLLSDNDYVISINYTYDLNDGNPIINDNVELSIHTLKVTKPTVIETTPLVTLYNKTYVTINITEFELITSVKIIEKNGDNIIQTIDCILSDFVKDTGGYQYETIIDDVDTTNSKLIVVYEFNLNDGSGNYVLEYKLPL